VRSCMALRDMCLAYEIPLLSGKDSMYVDGHLPGRYGETHKLSALESLQFSATGVIADITRCVTLDPKMAGDLVYIIGDTYNEMGASEYYDLFGYVGSNVPRVHAERFMLRYRALAKAILQGLVASAHGIYRGGLGVHLAMKAMAGHMGLEIDLSAAPAAPEARRDDILLYAESAGRLIVTVDPNRQLPFEALFESIPMACIGRTTSAPSLTIRGLDGNPIIDLSVADLKTAWKKPFGDLI
jgi:phosphoribosylformylglycinamidine synthase subunit PurSL